jgi:hypothetical protein
MRVLIYVPTLPPQGATETTRRVLALRDVLLSQGTSVRILGRIAQADLSLPATAPAKPGAFPQGNPDDFAVLQTEAANADVLYCPQAFGILPPDTRTLLPLPTFFVFGPLVFEEDTASQSTQRYRREFRRLLQLGARCLFEREDDYHLALTYGVAPHRCGLYNESELASLFTRFPDRPELATASITSKEQRVAWIMTHGTLREAEAKLLRELGFEVWTTKQVHHHPAFRSGFGDYTWDEGLSLPTDVLRLLNQHNFYEDPLTPEVAAALNGYFGTVLIDHFPDKTFEVLKHFQGRIVIRAWGRESPLNYSEYLDDPKMQHIRERMHLYRKRIFFTPCYTTVPEIETPFLQSRAKWLPLALPDSIFQLTDTWRGGDRRVLFFCPSIRTAPAYYGRIYKYFKRHFGRFPHLIAGAQSLPIRDKQVTGFVSDQEMRRLFQEMQVMYYHSREPRHIHYHPLEAIVYGMPVIYMRGGLMEAFDSGSQAGACDTEDEAREKIRRVLQGDQAFIHAVRESQRSIIEPFRPSRVREVWEKTFLGEILGTQATAIAPARSASLPPKRWQPALPPLPDNLDAMPMPLPTRIMVQRVVRRRMTTQEIRKGTDIATPPRGVFGYLRRAGYIAYKFTSMYVSAVASQRTLRPRHAGLRPYAPHWVRWFFPSMKLDFHTGPEPDLDGIVPLRSEPLPLDALPKEPCLLVDPVGWIDPRQTQVAAMPFSVAYSRLPGEEDDGLDKLTPSVQAETKLWMQMAREVIFCCEEDRSAAIRRYGVAAEKTAIAPGGMLYGPVTELPASGTYEHKFSRAILACGAPLRRENVSLLQEALKIREQRGHPLPNVVWVALAQPYPERHIPTGIEPTRMTEAEFRLALRTAKAVVVQARSGAEAARRVFLAALARVPVLAVASPAVRAQWSEAEVRFLPADDPYALAECLSQPADAGRIEAAYRKAVTDNFRWQARWAA